VVSKVFVDERRKVGRRRTAVGRNLDDYKEGFPETNTLPKII